MKRFSFLAVVVIALLSFNPAKAQVGVHIGMNFGQPVYYAPPRPVVVYPSRSYYYHPAPVYSYRRGPVYYRRPVHVYHYRNVPYHGQSHHHYYKHYRR